MTFPRGWKAGTAACGIKAFTAGASAIPTGQRDDLAVLYPALRDVYANSSSTV